MTIAEMQCMERKRWCGDATLLEIVRLALGGDPLSSMSSRKQIALNLLLLLVVTAVTLGVVDLLLIATGLFPPTYERGVAGVGWVAAPPTGAMRMDRCRELEADSMISYARNEDGARTSQSAAVLRGKSDRFEVVVSGDSHTDLCAANEQTHFGVTEAELNARKLPSTVVAYGAGKYSPLQAYLAIEPLIREYHPDAFVLNLYTGNDFYDMVRVDDRPHFVREGDGYRIADPVWYSLEAPDAVHRSRVRFAARKVADAVGVRTIALRVSYLRQTAAEQGEGMGAVMRYIGDLRKAAAKDVGYPQAFSAQMLNQQLFFRHFPGSRDESVRRVRALLELIRARHPDLLLMLSPIPSYELVLETTPDSTLESVLSRLPIDFASGVAEEGSLYSALRSLAEETGWSSVDNLGPLRAAADRGALFNHFDYHLTPAASAIIGGAQAERLQALLRASGHRQPTARPSN